MPPLVARRRGPARWAALTLLAAAALARAAAADPPDPKAAPPPAAAPAPATPPKALSGDDARKVAALSKAIDDLWRAGKFAEAVEPARQAAAVCEQALGPDHWRTADARRRVETLDAIAGLPEEGRRALAAVPALHQAFSAGVRTSVVQNRTRRARACPQLAGRVSPRCNSRQQSYGVEKIADSGAAHSSIRRRSAFGS